MRLHLKETFSCRTLLCEDFSEAGIAGVGGVAEWAPAQGKSNLGEAKKHSAVFDSERENR